MRALCGAIITAGSVIGLGLCALGFGTRYGGQISPARNEAGDYIKFRLSDMDTPLVFILVMLTLMAIIGLGITFLGLAYHHHRRYHEMLHHRAKAAGGERIGV